MSTVQRHCCQTRLLFLSAFASIDYLLSNARSFGTQSTSARCRDDAVRAFAGSGRGRDGQDTCDHVSHGQPDRQRHSAGSNSVGHVYQQGGAGNEAPDTAAAGSSFHSWCVRELREDIESLGYPKQFTIYDRGDQESAARRVLRDIRVGEKSMRPGDLINRISQWKMSGVTEDRAGDHVDSDFDYLASMAYRRYQQQLRASGAVDFDDLLLLTVRLFRTDEAARQKHQSRFDHVQIDEYQDTNGVQFELMEHLVAGHRNLCVVGDDDQSIYGWRGAEVEHILNFSRHFPGTRVVRLENNYRCTDQIIDFANRLVRHNRNRHDKKLIAHKRQGSPVRMLAFEDETTEAEHVVGEIAYLTGELGVRPADVAILFRTNEQPRLFETEMRRLNVPYRLFGGQSFFDRKEIRDVLCYLKVLASPADESSLLRIINTPARGIGSTTTEKLVGLAVERGISLWHVIPEAAQAGTVSARALAAVSTFRQLLGRYRAEILDRPQQMADITRRLLKEIDYDGEINRQYKDEAQQEQRRAVVEDLVNSIGQYVEREASPTLHGFLETTALMDRDEEPSEEEHVNQVSLMTLHSAKGLEFPRVYLVGMEENLLPHKRSVESGLEKDISEERRLAYVGVTRAMDHLTLTRAKSRMKWGKRRESIASRFLFEMQAEPGAELQEEHVGEQEQDETVDMGAPF